MTADYTYYVENDFAYVANEGLEDFARRQDYVVSRMAVADGMRVLDVGGGSGQLAAVLAHRGCRVTMMDVSARGVEFARRTCQRVLDRDSFERITFVVGNLAVEHPQVSDAAAVRDPFDVVCSVCVWEHLDPGQWDLMLRNMAGLTGARGRVVVVTNPNRVVANAMRLVARVVLRHRGGYSQEHVHINEQSYWSLKRTLRTIPSLRFTVQCLYFRDWLYGEARVFATRSATVARALPVLHLGSRIVDCLYQAVAWLPLFRHLLCVGFYAEGTRVSPRSS